MAFTPLAVVAEGDPDYASQRELVRTNLNDHESRLLAIEGATDSSGFINVATATFDPSANSGERTVAAHTLGVTIPDDGIIVGGFVEVLTTFADGASDAATIAISVEGANDIVSAIAISDGTNPWDAGKHGIVPKMNTPESTSVKTSAARLITATVAVHALTAGKLNLFLFYVQGN